jgi:hypothetical protein
MASKKRLIAPSMDVEPQEQTKKPPLDAPDGEQSERVAQAPAEASEPTEKPAQPDALQELLTIERLSAKDEQITTLVNRHIDQVVESTKLRERFNVAILFDGASINRSDADRIYQALTPTDRKKPVFLVLKSPGGDVRAAYFIGKLCRECTDVGFEVAVPREAKSAATLICCAADKIHMGSLSELGPIDPQIGQLPALAVKHSLEHLAELVGKYPGAKDMLSDYLARSLPINILGYLERTAGSAVQYAQRLLDSRAPASREAGDSGEIARRLVYDYMDHGIAIDHHEATEIFGAPVIASNSDEYRAANTIYEALDLVEFLLDRRFKRHFYYTGTAGSGCWVAPRKTQDPS